MINLGLHERLIARQSDAELKRKAKKARNRSTWAQEEIDWAERWATGMAAYFERMDPDGVDFMRRRRRVGQV